MAVYAKVGAVVAASQVASASTSTAEGQPLLYGDATGYGDTYAPGVGVELSVDIGVHVELDAGVSGEVAIYDIGIYDYNIYDQGINVPATVTVLDVKPPLELHAELVAADGTSYRWGSSVPDAGDVVHNVTFASKRFEGFERSSCGLQRPIDRDYPDLGLFDSLNFIGYDGSVAHEARVAQIPRSTPHGIDVEATGWMAHARDRKFTEIYVDRELGRWGGWPAARRRAVAGSVSLGEFVVTTDSAGNPALVLSIAGVWVAAGFVAEAFYDAGPGLKIGSVYYDWLTNANLGTGGGVWAASLYSSVDETFAVTESTGDFLTGAASTGTGTFSPTPQRYLMAQLGFGSAGGADGVAYELFLRRLAVYGAHGLTKRPTAPGEPDGFYASDIIKDICSRFCPRLNTGGVQDTTWPVPQAAFHDRTDPYDAWLALNAYHLWGLEVWENRTLHYYPPDLSDYDWEIRRSDPGVSVQLQGDQTDQLANYCVVQFQNVRTGQQDTVGPDEYPELRDDDVENPVNRHGLDREFGISLSVPVDREGAAQIGRAALAEFNQPKGIGTITFKGHIRDRAGHWRPGWQVRAGETVAITDFPNSRPRMIGEVSWDQANLTGTIAVDSTLKRLDAYLDRFSTALVAGGLSG